MHLHELLFYTVINDPKDDQVTLCVTNYTNQAWPIYNQISVLIHYLVPCSIQFVSITILIVTTARHRALVVTNRTYQEIFVKQFKASKELFITPLIILLSALPQAIIAFSLACIELNQSWQRYILLSAYFLSYSPQLLGFVLFVLPSSAYKEEFYKTKLAKIFSRTNYK
ncbi:unnamed protein product [Rotaria sp. Silwood2]|nr:unnamed protein product [Rotaria sp. Silwood2]CAF2873941.1 unnamed protein product [Rotaria sp. Silwood2]CAF3108268.1 unnamed protein product [Rotaria sp. Silwood2]CAF3250202.1 unnamed protein product [Rotaria sp. Silwood2]CAF4321939.1 unnamed protein product [Rotaria sp. Silwood2]